MSVSPKSGNESSRKINSDINTNASICWHYRSTRTAGLVFGGTVMLLMFGYGLPARLAMSRLENQYPPLLDKRIQALSRQGVAYIVVLGSGHISDPRLPVTSQVDRQSLFRLAEGIRILHHLPEAKLVFTGGPGFDPRPNAQVVAELARLFGVLPGQMVIRTTPSNTVEEAQAVKPLVGDRAFVMVTTASHMPRAMRVFQKQGLNPVAAPADYELKHAPGPTAGSWFPDSEYLQMAHAAVYELLGQLWYRLRGHI
jgi:uncharacterized SAM-binding protein YcdF (DUF218 family)